MCLAPQLPHQNIPDLRGQVVPVGPVRIPEFIHPTTKNFALTSRRRFEEVIATRIAQKTVKELCYREAEPEFWPVKQIGRQTLAGERADLSFPLHTCAQHFMRKTIGKSRRFIR